MEFQFKKNIKVVVDFEIGEEIKIEGYGIHLNGKHRIVDIRPNYGGCESGIEVKLNCSGVWFDLGWIDKLKTD